MMKIGARAHDYGRQLPEALFNIIAHDGFDAVMIAIQKAITDVHSYDDVTPALLARIDRARRESGLSLDVLGAYMELSLIDVSAQQVQIAAFCKGMHAAKALGAHYAATETTAFTKQPHATKKEAYAALTHALAEILPEAERLGVCIALEPVYYHTLATPEQARVLWREMASDHLAFVFDPVNLLDTPDFTQQDAMWERVFECIGDKIAVVHMKGARIENGKPKGCDFAHSEINYPALFTRLRTLGKDLPVIREEVNPMCGVEDAAFLRGLASCSD